ncbi:MAG: hypothetical protein AMXMBFR34_40610 [Myxococcaceae bacterium]
MVALSVAAWAQSARIVLRWKEVPGAKAYELQIAKDPSFVEVVLQTQTKTPGYRWEELPAATHWYRVRSFDAEGRPSEWSPAQTIAVDSAVPALLKPEEGAVVTCGGAVTFELGANALVKEYVLELSATQDFARPRVLSGATPAFTVSDLSPGTWWWRAKAVDVKGRAAGPGPARSVQVRLAAPKPRTVGDVVLGTQQVTLGWGQVACAARWVVEATHDGKERVSIPSTQPTLAFKTGTAGEYRWKVAAVDGAGRTGEFSAEQTFRVRLATPEARGESWSGRVADLSWSPVPSATAYRVELFSGEGTGTPRSSAVVGVTTWRTPELSPGRYTWQVTAKDAQGHTSAASAPRSFERGLPVVLPAPALEAPREGQVFEGAADVALSWGAVPGASRYEVQVDEAKATEVGSPPFRPEALAEGAHQVKLRALGGDGVSPWSAPRHFHVGLPEVARADLALVGLEVRVTLRDSAGHLIERAEPKLRVSSGQLGPVEARRGQWVAQWTPPAEGDDTLSLEEHAFRAEWPLRPPQPAPLVVGAFAGGLFSGGAVASPTGVVSVAWKLPVLKRRLALELRGGFYATSSQVPVGPVTVAGSGWLFPLALMVGWHQPVGAYVLRGALGPGLQLGAFVVDGARSTAAAPGLELVAGVGRRLGPGRVEVELGYAWARFETATFRLNAGGVGIRVGYAVDLLGGR